MRYKFGQSLIEVVVAVAVVAALAVALVTTSLVTQKASRGSENNTEATKLVQENIEQIRAFRDRKGFAALTTGTCLTLNTSSGSDPASWSLVAINCPAAGAVTLNNVVFTRSLAISSGNPNEKVIVVTVTWTDSGGNESVSNTTTLSACVDQTVAPPSPCI